MIDYVTDCIFVGDSLYCIVGTHKGVFHLLRITTDGCDLIESIVTGGHISSIRSVLWTEHALYTGGEDARVGFCDR